MTKSKTTLLLQSRREPTLESKSIADKRVLFGGNQHSMSGSFTEPWFDPYILCKSNAYQITVNCKLPDEYQKIINRGT